MSNMFNNSYNSGPSEFSGSQIGGGFVSNENNFNASNKPQRQNIPYDQRKLSQITIKQIVTADPPQPDEHLIVDGQSISQVAMVAQIQSIDIQSSHTTYKVTDYTGSLDAKQWTSDNQPQKPLHLDEGQWVRVFGRINHYNGRCSVNVFEIIPIADMNEITHHFLEVIYAHLLNTTKQSQPSMNQNTTNNLGGNDSNNMNQWNNNNGTTLSNTMNNMNVSALPRVQQLVLSIINSTEFDQSAAGCNVEQLFERLPDEDVNDIREAIDELSNAGQIYSTVDEEHYKYSGDQ